MNQETIHALCAINSQFYKTNASSFSATRQAPWHGWKTCAELFSECFKINNNPHQQFNVLDLACGNLRFEEFLSNKFPYTNFSFYAIDNCRDLLPFSQAAQFQNLNVVDALIKTDEPLAAFIKAPQCELSVSFGFMHHIPTQRLRLKALQALIDKTAPGGIIAVSFWEFLNNKGLAQKAEQTHKEALLFFTENNPVADANTTLTPLDFTQLEAGDYFLGWKDTPSQYRYCHHFSEVEIDELVQEVNDIAHVVARFSADGRTGNLNSYLILQKK